MSCSPLFTTRPREIHACNFSARSATARLDTSSCARFGGAGAGATTFIDDKNKKGCDDEQHQHQQQHRVSTAQRETSSTNYRGTSSET